MHLVHLASFTLPCPSIKQAQFGHATIFPLSFMPSMYATLSSLSIRRSLTASRYSSCEAQSSWLGASHGTQSIPLHFSQLKDM